MVNKEAIGIKKAICIGGSAGSFHPVIEILRSLQLTEDIYVFLCIHRGKNQSVSFARFLSEQTGKNIIEPCDKDPVLPGIIYFAPANYDLTIDVNGYFSLGYDEMVYYSRPSISIMFSSIAGYFKNNTIGILLSGANTDGKKGMMAIRSNKGKTIIQDPDEAIVPVMPQSCLEIKNILIFQVKQIIRYLNKVN